MAAKPPVLAVVHRHRAIAARARAEKSTTTVTPPARVMESSFRTVLAPKANWPS